MLHQSVTRNTMRQLRPLPSSMPTTSEQPHRCDMYRQRGLGLLHIASPQLANKSVDSNETDGTILPAGGAAL